MTREFVTVLRQTLRLRLCHRRVMHRRDARNVRHRRHGLHGGGLLRNHDRRSALDGDHFPALHAFVRGFLRLRENHGEQQGREYNVQYQRDQKTCCEAFPIIAVPRIAFEVHDGLNCA